MTHRIPEIDKGEIRHPTRTPEVIMKVIGPLSAETDFDKDETRQLSLYVLTHDFPRYHYVIVTDIIDSYTEPGNKFCVVHLITHSTEYDNAKIVEGLYDKASIRIDLTNSYVTRDKFLIPISEIDPGRAYGHFDLVKLKNELDY